tara:strand:- start:47 stop:496 length:450 start_codon:yes stop_codon:yes gene_type:complete
MSKTISFKGQLPIGEQDRIRLKTIKGKVGYRITKFQIINKTAGGSNNVSLISKIYTKDQTGQITSTVDFTESDLIATAYFTQYQASNTGHNKTIIFDNTVVNQDIFIYATDAGGLTDPCNYYIELETMSLSDIETTQLTLKSIRNITSR